MPARVSADFCSWVPPPFWSVFLEQIQFQIDLDTFLDRSRAIWIDWNSGSNRNPNSTRTLFSAELGFLACTLRLLFHWISQNRLVWSLWFLLKSSRSAFPLHFLCWNYCEIRSRMRVIGQIPELCKVALRLDFSRISEVLPVRFLWSLLRSIS